MTDSATVKFPLPPNLANSRMHWAVKDRKRQAYHLAALIEVRNRQRKGELSREPYDRLLVTPRLYVRNLMDEDNAVACLKWPLDALVKAGVVADDDVAHVTLGPVVQTIDRRDPRLELTLTPVTTEGE